MLPATLKPGSMLTNLIFSDKEFESLVALMVKAQLHLLTRLENYQKLHWKYGGRSYIFCLFKGQCTIVDTNVVWCHGLSFNKANFYSTGLFLVMSYRLHMHRDLISNLYDLIVCDRKTTLSPLCWQDSAWWRATHMNQRRGALTTFVWPPSLQVTGRAATATSVFSDCAFTCYNWAEAGEIKF